MYNISSWMDLQIIILTEESQEKQMSNNMLWNLKKSDTNKLFNEAEINSETQKTKL